MNLDTLKKIWARLDWVKELLYLSILATEACIIYPWQHLLFTELGSEPLPFWGLLALLWVAYLFSRLLARSKLTADRRQAITAGLVLLTALVAIRLHVYPGRPPWDLVWVADMVEALFELMVVLPADLLILILAMVTWWRGILASRQEADIDQVWYLFRAGVFMLLIYLVVAAFGTPPDTTGLLFGFFFFGLMSVALARILELGGIHSSTMGSRQWVGTLAGSILGSLGLALVVSLIFSRKAVRTVLGWFRPLTALIEMVIWYVVSAFVYLLWPLLELVLDVARTITDEEGFTFVSPLSSPLATPQEMMEQATETTLGPACKAAAILVIVVVGLYLVTRAVRRLLKERDEENRDERESLYASGDLLKDLREGLRNAWDQLRNLGQRGRHGQRSAASIRKMYASVVDMAAEAGYPRDLAETPYEHRAVLYQAFPEREPAVDAITEAYVRVHYGEVPDTREEMEQLRRYYRELQAGVADRAEE